jgi:hypothetical protein
LHPLAHYSEQYGCSIRSIKGWLAKGREKQDPPPFDEPGEMPAWWQRHFTQKVPDRLLGAEPSAPVAEKPKAPSAPPQRAARTIEDVEGMGLDEALLAMEKALRLNSDEYAKALCDPNADESKLSLLSRRVDTIVERMRKLQDSVDKRAEREGKIVHRSELIAQVGPVLAAMRSSLIGELQQRFRCTRDEAVSFSDAWFSRLRDTRFFTLEELTHAGRTAA